MKLDKNGWRADGVMQAHLRQVRKYARRQAVRWNVKEEQDLLRQFEQGFSIEDIASFHERSLGGIGSRLEALGAIPSATELIWEWRQG